MGWSDKYKRSIDCNNPKGFSQKAHCAGRKIRKENMKLSELKNTIRDLIQERSINAISKLQQKNIEDVQRTLDLYKKVKSKGDAKQIKKYIDVLKKLGKEKEKLAKELDDKVSGMYRDAEYKGESVVKELNISKDDMEKLHKDGEVEIGGEKVTFQNEGSMDWEKNFKWANDKELKVISKFIFMNPKGIDGVIKMSKHKPSDFKKTIQKAAKAGLYKESKPPKGVNESNTIGKMAKRYKNKDKFISAFFAHMKKNYGDSFKDFEKNKGYRDNIAKVWDDVHGIKESIDELSVNEGPSSEEKRIAMLAVRKQAKYRNVDLASAIQDQINALKELQRDVKRGKIKK